MWRGKVTSSREGFCQNDFPVAQGVKGGLKVAIGRNANLVLRDIEDMADMVAVVFKFMFPLFDRSRASLRPVEVDYAAAPCFDCGAISTHLRRLRPLLR